MHATPQAIIIGRNPQETGAPKLGPNPIALAAGRATLGTHASLKEQVSQMNQASSQLSIRTVDLATALLP